MRATAIAVAVMMLAIGAAAADAPQMKCRAAGERWFVCDALNVPNTISPAWRLYSSPLSYGGWGPTLSFPTPQKWSVVELTIDEGELHFVLSVEVRRYRGKVWFQKPTSTVIRNEVTP